MCRLKVTSKSDVKKWRLKWRPKGTHTSRDWFSVSGIPYHEYSTCPQNSQRTSSSLCTDRAKLVVHFVHLVSKFCDWIKSKRSVLTFNFLFSSIGILKICLSILCFSPSYLSVLLDLFSFMLDFAASCTAILNSQFFSSSVFKLLSWHFFFCWSCITSFMPSFWLQWAHCLL